MRGLKKAGIELDRKSLADLAATAAGGIYQARRESQGRRVVTTAGSSARCSRLSRTLASAASMTPSIRHRSSRARNSVPRRAGRGPLRTPSCRRCATRWLGRKSGWIAGIHGAAEDGDAGAEERRSARSINELKNARRSRARRARSGARRDARVRPTPSTSRCPAARRSSAIAIRSA